MLKIIKQHSFLKISVKIPVDDWEKAYEKLFLLSAGIMACAVVIFSLRTNYQPWYFLLVLPYASMYPKKYLIYPVGIFSIVSLLTYVPYFFTGNWDKPIPDLLNILYLLGIGLSLVTFIYIYRKENTHST